MDKKEQLFIFIAAFFIAATIINVQSAGGATPVISSIRAENKRLFNYGNNPNWSLLTYSAQRFILKAW